METPVDRCGAVTPPEQGAEVENFQSHISRRVAIGESQLLVLDGLFSDKDIAGMYAFLEKLPYRLNDIDVIETKYAKHWKVELTVEMALKMPVFRECVDLTRKIAAKPLLLERVHSNLNMYGDMQFPHFDLPGGVTSVYSANQKWEEKWLGETVFYDGNRDPLYTVAPRPGRLVVFDGDILHRAGVPSRECHGPRISVAFKFAAGLNDYAPRLQL